VTLPAGDMGAASAKTYDVELWFPGQGRYREVASISNTTDYQARRLQIRLRGDRGTEPLHTLNGTAVTDRFALAVLENYQRADGSVEVPAPLVELGAPSIASR
jgi:seryl-tRNA synthetase